MPARTRTPIASGDATRPRHSLHGGWEQFCAAAWRHRPVLGAVRRWVERWDERVRAQLARRPSARRRQHGRVVTNAGLERKLAHVEEWLEPRRNALRNRERLNRLLMLLGAKDGYAKRDGHMVDPADIERRAAFGK